MKKNGDKKIDYCDECAKEIIVRPKVQVIVWERKDAWERVFCCENCMISYFAKEKFNLLNKFLKPFNDLWDNDIDNHWFG